MNATFVSNNRLNLHHKEVLYFPTLPSNQLKRTEYLLSSSEIELTNCIREWRRLISGINDNGLMGPLCSFALLKTPEYEPFHLQIGFVPERGGFFVAVCGRRLDVESVLAKDTARALSLKFHYALREQICQKHRKALSRNVSSYHVKWLVNLLHLVLRLGLNQQQSEIRFNIWDLVAKGGSCLESNNRAIIFTSWLRK